MSATSAYLEIAYDSCKNGPPSLTIESVGEPWVYNYVRSPGEEYFQDIFDTEVTNNCDGLPGRIKGMVIVDSENRHWRVTGTEVRVDGGCTEGNWWVRLKIDVEAVGGAA